MFGQQPIIQIMVVGANIPAEKLKKSIFVNVQPKTVINMAEFGGNHRAQVQDSLASFIDLSFSNYGRGFVLEFSTDTGLKVSFFYSMSYFTRKSDFHSPS